MKIGAIIAARMSSTRLPGKVLRTIKDKPLLWYILSRLKTSSSLWENCVVATSSMKEDDRVAEYCEKNGVSVFRGELDRVAVRLYEAATHFGFDYFFRVNGDSPFVDLDLFSKAIDRINHRDCDLVTNLKPRSFPYGVAVELIKTEALGRAIKQMQSPLDFEHPTAIIYDNPEIYSIENILREGESLDDCRLTVDTEEDFELFNDFIKTSSIKWNTLSYVDAVRAYGNTGV